VLNEVTESCKSLFQDTSSPLLKEFVTRKHQLSKWGSSIFSKIKNELILMINSKRLIIYNFYLLSLDSRG